MTSFYFLRIDRKFILLCNDVPFGKHHAMIQILHIIMMFVVLYLCFILFLTLVATYEYIYI
jgi:hypothetical protein